MTKTTKKVKKKKVKKVKVVKATKKAPVKRKKKKRPVEEVLAECYDNPILPMRTPRIREQRYFSLLVEIIDKRVNLHNMLEHLSSEHVCPEPVLQHLEKAKLECARAENLLRVAATGEYENFVPPRTSIVIEQATEGD